jgi:hypothetical protein
VNVTPGQFDDMVRHSSYNQQQPRQQLDQPNYSQPNLYEQRYFGTDEVTRNHSNYSGQDMKTI